MGKMILFIFAVFYGVLIASGSYLSSMGKVTFDDQRVISTIVKDPYGKALGVIDRVFTAKTDNAKFAIVLYRTHDKYGNAERRFIAVPVKALKISEMKSNGVIVVLNRTEKKLDAAPFFDPARIENPRYDANIYRFYGLQPSWSENGMEKFKKEDKSEKFPYFNWEYFRWQYMWE